MKTFILITILVLSITAHEFAPGIKTNQFTDTEDNFKTQILQNENSLVFFYQTWCRFCKEAIPELNTLSKNIQSKPYLNIVAVNCAQEERFCEFNNIKGYPVIKFFEDYQHIYKYQGARSSESFYKYLIYQKYNKSKNIAVQAPLYDEFYNINSSYFKLTIKTFDQLKSPQFTLFYTPNLVNQQLFENYNNIAKNNSDISFSIVDCDIQRKMCKQLDINKYPTIIYITHEEQVVQYQGEINSESLKQFSKQDFNQKQYLTIDQQIAQYEQSQKDLIQKYNNEITYNYQQQFLQLKNIFNDEVKFLRLSAMFILPLIIIFFCLLKDCATRSTRKPKSN